MNESIPLERGAPVILKEQAHLPHPTVFIVLRDLGASALVRKYHSRRILRLHKARIEKGVRP